MGGVFDGASHQPRNVIVGEVVEDVFAVPAPADEAFGPEHLQALGDRRHADTELFGEGADAMLLMEQAMEDLQTARVSSSPEHASGALGDVFGELRMTLGGVVFPVAISLAPGGPSMHSPTMTVGSNGVNRLLPQSKGVKTKGMGADDELRTTLREKKLRATPARIRVLALLRDRDKPLSHADVVDALDGHGFDRATLYRNLMDFVQVGLAHRENHGDRVWRFALAGGIDQPTHAHVHPHFVCTQCGDMRCLPEQSVAVESLPEHMRNAAIQLRGLCETCT